MGAHAWVLCVILCGGAHVLEARLAPVLRHRRTLRAAVVRLIVAHCCSYWMLGTLPLAVASQEAVGAVVVNSFFGGPALWLAWGTLAMRLPFKVHFPVHFLAFLLSSAPLEHACAAVSHTLHPLSVFRSLEGRLDSMGLWLLDFVSPLLEQDYEKDEFARRLATPCSNPCAAFHIFLNFWAGFVVPSVVVWCAEKRQNIRQVTETCQRKHRSALQQPAKARANDVCYGKGLPIVIHMINVALLWEVSWRVAKRMSTDN